MPRIHGFDAYRVAMPHGRRPESLLVRVTTGEAVGWGEVAFPLEPQDHPADRPETDGAAAERIWADLEGRLAPALLGAEWDGPEDVAGLVQLGAHPAAAAVDIACWDLWCRLRGAPVSHALGGTRTSVVTGARIGRTLSLDTLVTQVNRYVGGGYARVTVEVRPGWDVEPIRAIRAAFPALALVADAGGAYTESPGHLTALEALDGYGLLAIERPFRTGELAAHARLQRQLATLLCPDIDDVDTLDAAIGMEAGKALSLRVGRLGGLTATRAAHDRAYAAGWQVWCGSTGAFGIGQAAAVAVASLPGCTLPSDVTGLAGGPQFVSPPLRSNGGMVAVPLTQPGLGHDVDVEAVTRLATRRLRVAA